MTWSPDTYKKAWDFATLAHQGQTYGGPQAGMQIDYVNHIGSVAMEVIWALPAKPDCDADLAIQCALLHDVIEDTDTAYADILDRFGQAVAVGVIALTKDPSLPSRQAQMDDCLQRIQKQPQEIWMVKMADRITNLYHPPYYWNDEKIEIYRQESVKIYQALCSANEALASRLHEKIEQYKNFFQTS